MMQGLYSGASGVKAHSEAVGVVGNNLANVNTIAYKQQSALFQDVFNTTLPSANAMSTGLSQLGMGAQMATTRTLFTEGNFEPASSNLDLAIGGKGFFKVMQGDTEHYTRAGNFRFDVDGTLCDPNGYSLMGIQQSKGADSGVLTPISLDMTGELAQSAAIPTSFETLQMNLGFTKDKSAFPPDPYFSMLNAWNATATPPLADKAQSYAQPLTVYDAAGQRHDLNISFDGAPDINGFETVEFLVQMPPAEDASIRAGTDSAGLLMAGTLTFNKDGTLQNLNAFTPTGADGKNLASWTSAPLVNGVPALTAEFAGLEPQTIRLNMGMSGTTWGAGPASAAEVGQNGGVLAGLENPTRVAEAITRNVGSTVTLKAQQDGFPEGTLNNLHFNDEGYLIAEYSNNTSAELYRVPLFSFNSEDGLRREGMNHYSAPASAGDIHSGKPGTEHYGKLQGKALETSNVDTAREMVNLIIYQRGLQSSSKSVTTADTMLQKALEIKR